MAKPTHTIMSHSLAKALMEAGMHHFDAGGPVVPLANATPQPASIQGGLATASGDAPGMIGQQDPVGSAINNSVGQVSQNAIQGVGGVTQGIAEAFTPQNTYQAGLANTDYTNFQPNIATAGTNALSGYGTAQNIQAQQQNLANQLLEQSQGGGPNPAQAALNTNTGQNAAMQAALMASQRGAGANVGQLARQAAQTGAATQQGAIGQAATLGAQQQLTAEQTLEQQQANQASGNVAEQNALGNIYGTSVAGQNTQNANEITNLGNAQGINAQVSSQNAAANQKSVGGLLGGASSAVSSLFYKGGTVGAPEHLKSLAKIYYPKKFSDGGGVASPDVPNTMPAAAPASGSSSGGSGGGMGSLMSLAALMKDGGKVGGKAKVQGNSPKNDTQLTLLSPGEDVLPRSVTMAPDAPKKAADFVRHLQETKAKKAGNQKGYEAVAKSKGSLKDRVEKLEAMCGGGYV